MKSKSNVETYFLSRICTFSDVDCYEWTHWGRVMHICFGNLTIIGSDNGLAPGPHQAIIWTDAGILLIGPLGTNFSEILIEILRVSFKKLRLKGSSAKWWPFCLCLNVLRGIRSIVLLLILWLLASSSLQQLWYWLWRSNRLLSFMRNDFVCLHHFIIEKW